MPKSSRAARAPSANGVDGRPSPRGTTAQQSPVDAGRGAVLWLAIVHGGVTIVFGALLLLVPDRTLALVATLVGLSLCGLGLIELVSALRRGLTGAERTAQLGLALLAAVAGIVVIARPEGSVRVVAVVAGVYLVIMGVTTVMLGSPRLSRGASLLRGSLALLAGVALLAWPDVTVGVIATLMGVFLALRGVAELVFGIRLSRTDVTT